MNTVHAAIGIIEIEGKILIGKRKTKDVFHGMWEFPGGKIKQGEPPREALRRELHEELGVEARIGDVICRVSYDYEHAHVELTAYRAHIESGKIQGVRYDEILLVSPAELDNYHFPPANKSIISALLHPSS